MSCCENENKDPKAEGECCCETKHGLHCCCKKCKGFRIFAIGAAILGSIFLLTRCCKKKKKA